MSDQERLNGATVDELRNGVNEYFHTLQPQPRVPEVPGTNGLTPQQKEAATDLFEASIMKKAPDQLTQAERDYLAAKIRSVLFDLNR